MALMRTLKNLGSGLGGEIREAGSLLRRANYKLDSSALGINFRKFGPSFEAYEFDAFVEQAKQFYKKGIHSSDPLYTVVDLPGGRMAIDYNGEIRGIYTEKGRPLAYFRPDYRSAGYRNKAEELEDYIKGKTIA